MRVDVTQDVEDRLAVLLDPPTVTELSTMARLRRLIGRFPGLQHAYHMARKANGPRPRHFRRAS